jgi:hypothetical protein
MYMAVTVELGKIVDALETFEVWQAFLNVETGEVEEVSTQMLSMAEETGEEEEPELSDDDRDEFDLATKIVSSPENFLSLPDEDDIHEWSIMEKFAESVKSGRIREELLRALHGRGAYRRFKDAVARHDLQSDWYEFRDEALKQIVIEWCEGNNLPWK